MKLLQETIEERQKAVLYCRVSDRKQKTEGSGLESQEHRCRQYAEAKGYDIEAVFPDDISGGGDFMKRPGMVALLSFLDAQPDKNYVVIFDDLKRFARDTEFHIKLRREMKARGAIRECLNFNFEDSPEGEFHETIAAAAGTLERKQNARQVRQKMRARVEKGYYVFGPVLGYHYVEMEGGGKVLAPHEPNASIVKEALEGFASGRFQTATEVQRFLNLYPSTERKYSRGGVYLQAVLNLLRNPLYAGRISIQKYDLHLHPGKHEPLISFATWQKIQERLEGTCHAPARKDLHKDFPLRGFVDCAECNQPLSASWSKGRNALYAYYHCFEKSCAFYKKSIRRDKIEGDFEALLKELQPTKTLLALAYDLFSGLWQVRLKRLEQSSADIKASIAQLEKKSEQLMDRLINTENETLISAYEGQIKKLETQKVAFSEKSPNNGRPLSSFDDAFRTAMAFLANPWK